MPAAAAAASERATCPKPATPRAEASPQRRRRVWPGHSSLTSTAGGQQLRGPSADRLPRTDQRSEHVRRSPVPVELSSCHALRGTSSGDEIGVGGAQDSS